MGATHILRPRLPRGERRPLNVVTDPDLLAAVREDAAHYPGGHAIGLVHPETEADVAEALASGRPVLAIGAQSSLTGGATPQGELVVATDRLGALQVTGDEATVGSGVTLDSLVEALGARDACYPPVPTYTGATIGGVTATNAAGPATFKHGTTRDWIVGLTVVLASGHVLELRRGEVRAHPDGYFSIATDGGDVRVPISAVTRPDVPKCSAGYPLADQMDAVDLFIGAEGTLGIVTSVTLRLLRRPPATCLALIALADGDMAVELAGALRHAAQRTWRAADPRGIDLSAIEHADARCITLLREDGIDREFDVPLHEDVRGILLVSLDLPPATSSQEAWTMVENALDASAADTPITRFCQLLAERDLLDRTELAMPGDLPRHRQLQAVREAIPEAVNRRVARAQQTVSSAISKLAGDFVVPFSRFAAMERACRDACTARDLDLAVWGHISDGNIHPNVIPRRADDLDRGREALLEAGRVVIALGGSPLAEHGVGRNPLKQRFLRMLHGDEGIRAMSRVKQAFDPKGILAPGVLLPRFRSGLEG